jgi:hypothetical protein
MENFEYLIVKWTLGFSFFGVTLIFIGKLGKLFFAYIEKEGAGHLFEILKEVIVHH